MQDQNEHALAVLQRLHGSKDSKDDVLARQEYVQIHEQIQYERTNRLSLWNELKKTSVRKRFLTALFVQSIAQSTGVLVTSNYQVLLWGGLGVTGYLPLMLYGIYNTWACILNLVASRIVDRVGRVRLFSIGMVSP